eukprot:TRINITY_DN8022_c0_g1_i1.p1 TRINITY_DN8022_c0_g1~~TRINITY_DN8022_c0_g1_i1.p1  ORF type:complete len:182 (-),score=42.12 TRINITY_DN8022_c0_g1_i1:87-575(-)
MCIRDRNIIVSVHYYDPFFFTHQGADWVGPEVHTLGVVWPGPPPKRVEPTAAAWNSDWSRRFFEKYNDIQGSENPASPETMEKDFKMLAEWSKKNNRPINIGEFGAYGKADMESRKRWTTAVVKNAVANGFSFHYWEFCSGFGVYDDKTGLWNGLERILTEA